MFGPAATSSPLCPQSLRCWSPCGATTTTSPSSTASGVRTETQRCSSGSCQTRKGKKKKKREVANEPFYKILVCLSESCVLVRAGSGVCPTTVPLRMGPSPGLTSVDMKAKTSPLASNIPSISFRRQQRPSAHLSHRSLWTSPSTVSIQEPNSNKLKLKRKK